MGTLRQSLLKKAGLWTGGLAARHSLSSQSVYIFGNAVLFFLFLRPSPGNTHRSRHKLNRQEVVVWCSQSSLEAGGLLGFRVGLCCCDVV